MNNILLWIMVLFMFICGGLSTLYVVISFPVVIIIKIYRKIKYGEKIM